MGKIQYNAVGTTGEVAITKRRNSKTTMKSCTWTALAEYVQNQIRARARERGYAKELPSCCETTVRRYCIQRNSKSIQAQKCDPLAKVGFRKLTAANCEFHIDAHATHALLRLCREAMFDVGRKLGVNWIFREWDDNHFSHLFMYSQSLGSVC